jgi:hypothetical protein
MALAFVVTLEKPLPDAAAAFAKAKAPGKTIARESERLDGAARVAGVTALTSLLSENPEKLAAQLREEGFDPAKMRLPAEQWFPAAEGLKTARGLAAHVTANLNNFKQPNAILKDLRAIEELLTAADAAGVKFHLTKSDI